MAGPAIGPSTTSGEQPVLHDAPYGTDPVLPSDLLALCIRAPVVADAHLVNAHAGHTRQLGRYLRFKAEAALFQIEPFGDAGPDQLVAGLRVRQVQIVERVGEAREKTVAGAVPAMQMFCRR
jgi:hypothetical protein